MGSPDAGFSTQQLSSVLAQELMTSASQLRRGLHPARWPHPVPLQTWLHRGLLRAVSLAGGWCVDPRVLLHGVQDVDRPPHRHPRCAPGFFGNPLVLGSSCQPCDCSGNSDPNMIFSDCDPLTGACHSCLRHTTGPRCESCAPGFFGNALLPGNCTRRHPGHGPLCSAALAYRQPGSLGRRGQGWQGVAWGAGRSL